MPQNAPFSIRVERPEKDFGVAMNEIRSWLDAHKIQPTGFKSDTRAAGVAFEIHFAREDEAHLFEQAFT